MRLDEGTQLEGSQACDHCSIVRAEFERRNGESEAFIGAIIFESLAQATVCGNTAGDDDRLSTNLFGGSNGFSCERIDDGLEHGSTKIAQFLTFRDMANASELCRNARLETTKREIEIVVLWQSAREFEGMRIATDGEFIDVYTTRVRHTDHFTDFVERLTRRIVNGMSNTFILANAADSDEVRVTARNNESDKRKGRFFHAVSRAKQRRKQMAFGVVNADERNVLRVSKGFGSLNANEKRPNEPWPFGDGHAINLVAIDARFLKRPLKHFNDIDDMRTAREFRHDTAVFGVKRNLARNHVGQNLTILNDGCRTFVT